MKFWAVLILLFIAAVGFLGMRIGPLSGESSPEKTHPKASHLGDDNQLYIRDDNVPFQWERLLELESFGKPEFLEVGSREWLIIAYFDHLTCTSCLNQNLHLLAKMNRERGERIGFVSVVQGRHFQFLRDLKRIGHMTYPLLIEEHNGQLGFSNHFQIALVHVKSNQIRLSYSPDSGRPDLMAVFEKRVANML